jgi:hypothetical protein
MSALYSLPTGNRPFEPDLLSTGAGQPNDFTIAIDYTAANNTASTGGSYMNDAETMAIDKIGNVWVSSGNGGNPYYFYELSPAGVVSNVNYQYSYTYGTPIVDILESAWAGSATTPNAITYVTATSTPTAAAGSAPVTYTYNTGATNSTLLENFTYASVADAFGNLYFGNNQVSAGTTDYIEEFAGAATTPTVTGTQSAAIAGITSSGSTSFISGAIQVGSTSAFFNYDAYGNIAGTTSITSVNLSTLTNNTGFPVYGQTNGSSAGALLAARP